MGFIEKDHCLCIVLQQTELWLVTHKDTKCTKSPFIHIISWRHPSQISLFCCGLINQATWGKLRCKTLPCLTCSLQKCNKNWCEMRKFGDDILNGIEYIW